VITRAHTSIDDASTGSHPCTDVGSEPRAERGVHLLGLPSMQDHSGHVSMSAIKQRE